MEFPLPLKDPGPRKVGPLTLRGPKLCLDPAPPSFDWLLFQWECGGEKGDWGVCLNDGDQEGFVGPSDDDARELLEAVSAEIAEVYLRRAAGEREILSRPMPEISAGAWEDALLFAASACGQKPRSTPRIP